MSHQYASTYRDFEDFLDGELPMDTVKQILKGKRNARGFCRLLCQYTVRQGYDLPMAEKALREDGFSETDILFGRTLNLERTYWPNIERYRVIFEECIKDSDYVVDFSEVVGRMFLPFYYNGAYYIWNGRYYENDEYNKIAQYVRTELANMQDAVRMNKVSEILANIRDYKRKGLQDLDQERDLLVFRNGMFNRKTGLFQAPDPTNIAIRVFKQDFVPQFPLPTALQEYMQSLNWTDMRQQMLLACMRAALTRRQQEMKKVPILHGVPNAGKTMLCKVLFKIYGMSLSKVFQPLTAIEGPYANADVMNVAFVLLDDIQATRLTKSTYEIIKQWSSWSPLGGRQIYKESQNAEATDFALWFTCNNLPGLPRKVDIRSIRDRFILFNYTESFEPGGTIEEELVKQAPQIFCYLLSHTELTDIGGMTFKTNKAFLSYWEAHQMSEEDYSGEEITELSPTEQSDLGRFVNKKPEGK